MTRPSLAGIEQRAAAATAGPWFQGRNGRPHESTCDVYSKREPHEPDSHDIATYVHSEEDAAFITDARTAVPAQAAAVRDVLAECERFRFKGRGVPDDMPTEFDEGADAAATAILRALAARLDLTDPEGEPT